jgi:radical SAM protein with 4Fe4S-binding SPASM domain
MRKKYFTEIINRLKRRDVRWLFQNTKKAVTIPYETITKKCISGPLLASIAITYRCNQRCLYCELPQRADIKRELPTTRFKQIIDQLIELEVSSISFTGGDPLLRKDVPELISYIKKNGISTNLTTNGMVMSFELAETLIDSGLNSLGISLDSTDPNYVNKIRGTPKAFEAAVNAIKIMAEIKRKKKSDTPNVTVSTVLTSKNCSNIKELVPFVKNLGANAISFGGVQVNFNFSDKIALKQHLEDKEHLGNALRHIREMRKQDGFIDNSNRYLKHLNCYLTNSYPDIKCYAGYHSILIDSYGNIFPCYQYYENDDSISHINEISSIKEFWYSHSYQKLRRELLNCKECFFVCQMEPNEIYNTYSNR